MNERIKELAVQAELPLLDVDGNCKYGDTYFSKEKFAELIVRECSNWLKQPVNQTPLSGVVMNISADRLKEHFGVKE